MNDLWRNHLLSAVSKDRDILLILFLLSCALRIYFAIALREPPSTHEAPYFNALAVSGGIGTNDIPLYPFFLRVLYSIGGSYNFRIVYIVQGILNSFLVLMIYHVAMRLWNRKCGIIAAAICALYPPFWVYNLMITTTSLSLLFVMLIMVIVVSSLSEITKSVIAAIGTGLGILLIPTFIFFIPGLLLILKRRREFVVTLVVILFPWTVRNWIVGKSIVPLYRPDAFSLKLHSSMYNINWYNITLLYNCLALIFKKTWSSKVASLTSFGKNASSYLVAYSYIVIMVLGLIGMIRRYTNKHRDLIVLMLGYVLFYAVFSVARLRFRVLLEPIHIIYASILICGKRRADDVAPK